MFGYVLINKAELKCREFEEYGGIYCGLCMALKESHGNISRFCVNYDLTFLSILLADLYDEKVQIYKKRCIVHPFHKKPVIKHGFQEYCADMTLLLSYYKCMDDWNDESKLTRYIYAALQKRRVKKIIAKYPDKCREIKKLLSTLSEEEKKNCDNIDKGASVFGCILSEIFAVKNDNFTNILKNLGFYLGKYIYVLDTYLDYEDDMKHGRYNPLFNQENDDNLKEKVKKMLTELISMAVVNYELLPLCEYAPILNNILYSGVWTRFYEKDKKNNKTSNS